MSLKTWWMETRLNRIDSKLRQKRGLLKRARQEAEEIERARKKGFTTEEQKAREAKLHHEREKLTSVINALMADEERLKRELADAGDHPATALRARP